MAHGGIVHQARHHEGMHPVFAFFIDSAVILVLGLQPATGGSHDRPGPRRAFIRNFKTRLRHCLFGGQQRILREHIEKSDLLTGEMILGPVVANLRAKLDRKTLYIAKLKRADTVAAIFHAIQSLGGGMTKRAQRTLSGNHHPPHEMY